MNEILAIQLADTPVFKQVQFKIPKGLTTIYGLNRAGGPQSKNSNGVGKSFLFSSLAEMIYEDPVVGEKQDRLKEGTRAFSFTSAVTNKKTTVIRSMKGRSEKIKIIVDGKDKEFRTPTIARKYLKKVFPLSQEDYNTYVHLDSRIPHPLVMGTTTQRKNFFTSFFGLDRLDAERKLFMAELNKLGKTKTAFQELRAQYNKSKEDLLTPEQLATYKAKAGRYKEKLEVLQKQFSEMQEVVRLLQFANSAKEQLRVLSLACGGSITVAEFKRAAKDNAWELEKVRKDIEDAEAWEQYKRDNKNYLEAYEQLSKATLSAIKVHSKEVRAVAESRAQKARALQRELTDLKKELIELAKIRDANSDIGKKKLLAPEGNVEDLKTALRAYVHQLEHAEQFAEGKCETCGQVVQIKDPQTLRQRVKKLKMQIQEHNDYAANLEVKKAYKEAVAKYVEKKARYENLQERYGLLKSWVSVNEELQNLPRKPKPFEGKKLQLTVLRRMEEEIVERKQLLEFCKPHLDSIIAFAQLTKEQISKAKDSNSLNERIAKLQNLLSSTQTKLEVHRTIAARQKETKERLIELKVALRDEEPLKLLVQGYQDKNIKKRAVEAISHRLMQLINKYARIVFPEDYTFSFHWGTQISLLVHRKYGKKVHVSDVRKLSGAESKLFTIILVLALLSFVPAQKRSSLLILDEPSANLSKEMTQSLADLVPVLLTVIPSIVIITPRSDEYYEGARAFTVIKTNGVSTIAEGMPHQIASK